MAISVAIAYVLVTTVHVIAGEQVPKLYAIVNAERVACWVSGPLQVFTVVMRPFVSALDGAALALLRPLGIRDVEIEGKAGAEDVKLMIAQGSAGGTLDPGEAGMLVGTVQFMSPEQVAEIALMAAKEVKRFGVEPKAALLSHSNFGSSNRPSALKMRQVLELVRREAPWLEIDGEMHGDAATPN